jgi:cephalosporin-C deacetylase-like acetyl esterase
MQAQLSCVWIVLAAAASVAATRAEDLRVLPGKIDGGSPRDTMGRYLGRLLDQAWQRWQADYEKRKTPEQVAAYQKRLREEFVEALGGFPKRTPLNARVTGVVRREGYRVEKVVFESQPKHFVTGALFLPDAKRFKPPYPGVLVPCGHTANAKAHDEYQTMGALLALNGMAGFVFDPIDQGERGQLLNAQGRPVIWGTMAHTMVGVGSILLGRNTARFEIWDGMRAIDYLQSRPEVDPKRIGCTGNSGGGTQTSFLMALDDRIGAAAPSCYLNRQSIQIRTSPGDAEQNIFGQLAFGLEHADFVMMRAPTPILICAATKDFFDIRATWDSFRYAKRLFTRMGFAERVDLLENDRGHNYGKLQREGVARWMSRWLLGKDQPITEPPIKLLSTKEIQCTPRGQVMRLEGARSVYDLNQDYEKELAGRRRRLWAATDRSRLLDKVRQIAGIRRLADLPKPKVQKTGVVTRNGIVIEKLILTPEEGIVLPALKFVAEKRKPGRPVLYVHERGKGADAQPGGPIEKLVLAGHTVLAVDLRGTGETQQTRQRKFGGTFGFDWVDVYAAYLLGRSYVGMRAEDVLTCARYLAAGQADSVRLVAVGNVGVPALHAAALEPKLFASVRPVRTLTSWSSVIHLRRTRNQLISAVHGALLTHDLPDLAATLGSKLSLEEPVDATGMKVRGRDRP